MIRGQMTEQKREVIKVPLEAKLHNRFDFEVIDSVTGKVKQQAYAENVILDSFWARIFAKNPANVCIHVGTGTGALVPTRTSLFTFLAGKASAKETDVSNDTEGWLSHKRLATWIETENQNTVWTEVGIAYAATAATLTTHALIKDLNGNPVAITKGITDIIRVYATVYAYIPVAGFLAGTVKLIMPRAMSITDTLAGWMVGIGATNFLPCTNAAALKGEPNVQSMGASPYGQGQIYQAYVLVGTGTTVSTDLATKKLIVTHPRIPAATHNGPAGIKAFMFSSGFWKPGDFTLSVPAPWFPYSSIADETVGTGDGVILDFKTAFPFVNNDASFVLKKNGALIDPADYSVDFEQPGGGDLLPYMKVVDYSSNDMTLGIMQSAAAGGWLIAENPWFEKYGINTFDYGSYEYASFEAATNLAGPWTVVGKAVAAAYQHHRYFKMVVLNGANYPGVKSALSTELAALKNIHFAAGKAPLMGDVITADYRCGVIAKNANNVFDLAVEITLQEKTV